MTFENVRDLTKEAESGDDRLLAALRTTVSALTYAYVLNWIPEQGASIYEVVVPDRMVALVEIPEIGSAEVTLISLQAYKSQNPRLSAEGRRKLAAIERVI